MIDLEHRMNVVFINNVIDPADVTLTGCGSGSNSDIDEDTDCTLTCDANDGNPRQFTYEWEFKRKFENDFTPIQHTSRAYPISSLTYLHAGEYKCRARNTGGFNEDIKVFNVICK